MLIDHWCSGMNLLLTFINCWHVLFSSYRIGPFEVESALTEHPAVAEAAVVSSPDPIRGEVRKKKKRKDSFLLYNLLAV